VIVAIMAFVFKGNEYSARRHPVFWALSIVAVALASDVPRDLRAARRAGSQTCGGP